MKLSVITPSFNQAIFIERTICSVVSQTGDFDLEYIIIDGGSTDGSVDIIKRYAAQDHRIRWISEPDHGQSDAINKGLRLATGDVVAYLNSDDIYCPGALQCITRIFQEQTVMWAYGRCRIINETDQEIYQLVTWYKNIVGWFYHHWSLLIVNYISQPAVFWRRSLLAEAGYLKEDEHLVMDYELWCRFGQVYPATVMHQTLASFRLYQTSKSNQGYVKQFTQEYAVARRYTKNFIILGLHKIHASLVILVYKFLR